MPRPKKEKRYLTERMHQIVFLLDWEGLSGEDIGVIIGRHRSTVNRILAIKPERWTPKAPRRVS